MILLFILLFSIFVIKPIVLALIRWITFKNIHKDELSNTETKDNMLTKNKIESLSDNLFSELDEVDKESKEDFENIKKIIDFEEKRKK